MNRYGKQFWRSMPFMRLLVPLAAGIIASHYFHLTGNPIYITTCLVMPALVIFIFLSASKKYKLRWLTGAVFYLLLFFAGSIIMYVQDIRNDQAWIGRRLKSSPPVLITLQEPLTEKPGSFRGLGKTEAILVKGRWLPVKGLVLLYFSKDSPLPAVRCGSQMLVYRPLQPITNSGNPGAFDYRAYCGFQGIHHQVSLKQHDYLVTGMGNKNRFTDWLRKTRDQVLAILRKYIPGSKEAGVAEALLIGYRDDLDRELVRAYSNTGVVHIIAISGLHLGMIYGLLLLLLNPFRKIKYMRLLKPIVILGILWGFSLLAGAGASILRSAVMFTFIVAGECLNRKTNIYNTLASSAFCLLLYDPHFLWDVGFQLSYSAVLGIVLFMKPIYKQVYFSNGFLRMAWQMTAVTISAQLLTLPLILYYFHQFPNLFLFTNFIAVPLSGFILYGELVLLVVAPFPSLAILSGKIIAFLVAQLNGVIERTDHLPFAATVNISVSTWQTILLYIATGYMAWWLMQKRKAALLTATFSLCLFSLFSCIRNINNLEQHTLIVYNIPRHRAIDIMEGSYYHFFGDTGLSHPGFLESFHLQPSRILHGVTPAKTQLNAALTKHLTVLHTKTVLIIDRALPELSINHPVPVDIIILSGNPGITFPQLAVAFTCGQYIFDSSNPLWKIRQWKKEADSLHLRHYSVAEQGAFERAL